MGTGKVTEVRFVTFYEAWVILRSYVERVLENRYGQGYHRSLGPTFKPFVRLLVIPTMSAPPSTFNKYLAKRRRCDDGSAAFLLEMQTYPVASGTPGAFSLSNFEKPPPVATGDVLLSRKVHPPRGMQSLENIRQDARALHDAPTRYSSGRSCSRVSQASDLRWGEAWI